MVVNALLIPLTVSVDLSAEAMSSPRRRQLRLKAVLAPMGRLQTKAPTRLLLLAALIAHLQPMFPARANAQSPSAAPPAPASNDKDQTEANSDGDEIPDPELIALTWQYRPQASGQRIRQPVWRPDGTRLTVAETDSLLDDVKSFQTHWRQPEQLSPLVMIFRRDTTIKTGVSVAVVLPDGRRLWSGSWGPFLPNGLSKSACAPQVRELAKWPDEIDIDVKTPLEEPQIIKTVQPIPQRAVEVAPGVRWYVDPYRGIDFKRGGERREHLAAAVLEIENDSSDSLVTYEATAWRRGQETPLRGSYATIIEPRPNIRVTIRVSEPLDDVNSIEKVEFTRQRFKIQRFKDVKLRLDLLLRREDAPDRPKHQPKLKQDTRAKQVPSRSEAERAATLFVACFQIERDGAVVGQP